MKRFLPGKKQFRNQQGIALLITLTIITVLITTALELNRNTRSALISSAATRNRFALSQMASSGTHAAMAILIKDKKESATDSIQEDWANPEKIDEVLNDLAFEEGKLKVLISDELSKIQVNALVNFPKGRDYIDRQVHLWFRFFDMFISENEAFEEIEPKTIIDCVKDWLDSGDDDAITGLNGAESDYYEDLDPSYSCRNGPFVYINELALVKDITPELFFGMDETVGLSQYLTVFGMTETKQKKFTFQGKININTAELTVLTALLPEGSEELATDIYNYREEKSDDEYIHELTNPQWYKRIPGGSEIKIDPNLITVSSDFFRIESTATLNEMSVTLTVIVKRELNNKTGKWICKILRFGQTG